MKTTYYQDGLATVHNADFRQEPRFAQAYKQGFDLGGWGPNGPNVWRVYVVCWAAFVASRLEGDFVECGVDKGSMARAVIEYVNFPSLNKRFVLMDTFEGLVEELITDAERQLWAGKHTHLQPGAYPPSYDRVVNTFAPYGDRVQIIRGAIPSTLDQVTTDRVAFMSIDMNCVAPEIAAIEFFWPRLTKGAIVVLDDYAWPGHIEQKKAHDAFARKHNTIVLSLPTGQGVLIKH
ncbi:MAG: TylF/MycF family methyltransferase [Magnetococcus sp. DMHC-8]